MLPALSLYAFLNAKIRALASFLLSPAQVEAIGRAGRLEEYLGLLQPTAYREIAETPEAERDPRLLEKKFLLHDIDLHKKILAAGKGRTRDVVFSLLGNYDLQNFKAALRLWFQPSEREEEPPYLISETICWPLDLPALIAADSFDALSKLLAQSPYRGPLRAARDEFQRRGNLLPIEVALDRDYYERLNLVLETLSSSDRAIARRLVGAEIDLENIKLLIRLREYYGLPLGEILGYLLPGGDRIDAGELRRLAGAADVRTALSEMTARSYGRIDGLFSRKADPAGLSLLEAGLQEILLRQARGAFRSFPFTIGTILAYCLFKRAETRFLISSLYAIVLGRSTR